MRNLSATICLTLAVLLGSAGMSWSADWDKGLTAYKSGDYATAAYESASGEFIQKIEGNKYKLIIRVTDVTDNEGVGQLHAFSMYRNDKFVHSSKYDGGRIIGCRFSKPDGGMKDFLNAEEIKNDMSVAIWRISLRTICGGTQSHITNHYIVAGPTGPYREHTIKDFEWNITTTGTDNTLTVYYVEQEYGEGATVFSIFVPRKYTIRKPEDWHSPNSDDQLSLKELLTLPWTDWRGDLTPISFLSLFQSCIDQQSPDICDYAVINSFKETDLERYNGYFNWTKGDLTKKIFRNYTCMMRQKNKLEKKMKSVFEVNSNPNSKFEADAEEGNALSQCPKGTLENMITAKCVSE